MILEVCIESPDNIAWMSKLSACDRHFRIETDIKPSCSLCAVWSESSISAFRIANDAIRRCRCTGWFESLLGTHVKRYVFSWCCSNVFVSGNWRPWSDCTDVKTNLDCYCIHMPDIFTWSSWYPVVLQLKRRGPNKTAVTQPTLVFFLPFLTSTLLRADNLHEVSDPIF